MNINPVRRMNVSVTNMTSVMKPVVKTSLCPVKIWRASCISRDVFKGFFHSYINRNDHLGLKYLKKTTSLFVFLSLSKELNVRLCYVIKFSSLVSWFETCHRCYYTSHNHTVNEQRWVIIMGRTLVVAFSLEIRCARVKWASDYPRLVLALFKSSHAHGHFQMQTQRFKAWIIGRSDPPRVRSAPWCNSPEDASSCRNMWTGQRRDPAAEARPLSAQSVTPG